MADRETELLPFSDDEPRCIKCGKEGASTTYRAYGDCEHDSGIVIGWNPNPRLCRSCLRCGHGWDEATVPAEQPTADRTRPHCPDGHTPPTGGSQPWSAWVGPERDGDGQPTTIHVARSAGAHVAESDAQWIRDRLNCH